MLSITRYRNTRYWALWEGGVSANWSRRTAIGTGSVSCNSVFFYIYAAF